MEPVTLKYRPHIDGLRAIAVLSVVAFHAFPSAFPGGFIGVDVFFVISGFLISSILYPEFAEAGWRRGAAVIRDFYSRRVRRIFPALIVVLAACLVAGYFILLPGELERMSLDVVASAGFFLNILLSTRTGYFDGSANSNPLLHIWSLGVEEQFYLLWPVAIWLILRCRLRILPAAIFAAAASYFWNSLNHDRTNPISFFLPQMRFWELLIGAIAAIAFPLTRQGLPQAVRPRPADALLANLLSTAGLALIGAGLIVTRSHDDVPDALTLLPTLGAALVVTSDRSAWTNRHILSNPVLVWIGLISYPLYLWHWPLLSFALIDGASPDSLRAKLAVVLASFVLAWLTYRLVEIPVRHGRKAARTTLMLTASMIALGCAAYFCKSKGGFPGRFPPLLAELSTLNYDPSIAWRQGDYFIVTDVDETHFKRDPNEIQPGKPTMYLWGDSHAAALYPGLNEVYGKKYNIVQRTAAGIPPFLRNRTKPGNAQRINQFVFDSIKRDRPEFVFLEARWPQYNWEYAGETITALKAQGVRHVVLVGPVPQWFISLPQQLFTYFRKHRHEGVPTRMRAGSDPEPIRVDALMEALAGRLGAEYISPCKIFEDKDGFLVRTGETTDSLVSFDYGHLTPSGSYYLVSHLPNL